MRRFFFEAGQRQGDLVTLDGDESHHIGKVLRLREGEQVELCDRSGQVFLAELVKSGKSAQLKIIAERAAKPYGTAELIVAQGGIKAKNMELVLQKCTELGVGAFYPYVGARSQGNRIEQYRGKTGRWQRIVDEACKQCLRPVPMQLYGLHSFEELIGLSAKQEKTLKLLLWEKEKKARFSTYAEELRKSESIILLLGPEGGFTDAEVAKARALGFLTITMGERILRAETAALAAVAIVQHYRGDM